MTTRASLLSTAGLAPLFVLASCASSSPPPVAADTAAAWQETTGTGTTTAHTAVQGYNNQILQSEHSMDAEAPAIPDGENHGLP